VPLLLESRPVGDVTVVTCRGRIVTGPECTSLMKYIDALVPISPHVILHLGEVEFIDSGGLGLLVRCLTRTRHAHGTLTLCAVSPKIDDVLKITKLAKVFQPYETEAEAIAAAHRDPRTGEVTSSETTVLCVDTSADVVAYVREILREAGYRVVTATNLPDAFILLSATQPKLIVIGTELYEATETPTAIGFRRQADARKVVKLPPDFSRYDAGAAARELLDRVRAVLEAGAASA
jgi:anti-anti-sigma factor